MSKRQLTPAEEREAQKQRMRHTRILPAPRTSDLLSSGTRPAETSSCSHDTQPGYRSGMSNGQLTLTEEREAQRQRMRHTETLPALRTLDLLSHGTRPAETSSSSHDTQPRIDRSQLSPPRLPPIRFPSTSGTASPPGLARRLQGSGPGQQEFGQGQQQYTQPRSGAHGPVMGEGVGVSPEEVKEAKKRETKHEWYLKNRAKARILQEETTYELDGESWYRSERQR